MQTEHVYVVKSSLYLSLFYIEQEKYYIFQYLRLKEPNSTFCKKRT